MAIHELTERRDVEAALEHPHLTPPPSGPSLGIRSTLRLRELMARFTDGSAHALRRAAVVEILDSIDLSKVDSLVRHLTRIRIVDSETDLAEIASTVPVDVVAALLGVHYHGPGGDPSVSLIVDVALVAGSIGADAPADVAVDAASSRVVEACGGWDDDGIAKASLLYQAYGATRSLIMSIVDCRSASGRVPAVFATERVAVHGLSVCGREIDSGDRVIVEIGAVGLEFGHGPHHCPGRILAELIAASVAKEFADTRYGSVHD